MRSANLAKLVQAAPPAPVGGLSDVRISVQDLTKVYGSDRKPVTAVDRVSFDIARGEFVALLGPSGCGKSTILNMIAGLLPRSAGDVRIDGHVTRAGEVVPKVGYVFQRDNLFPWRSVADNVGYGLELAGRPAAERRALVSDALHRAGLQEFADAFPLTLSGGMRQRAALMRSLVMKPEILLMDEPFGALDTHTKLDMHQVLLEIWEQERQTVLFVTHDLAEALTLADRIILLAARPGRLKESFRVPFARPRDAVALRETREFADAFSHIWHSLGEEFRKGKST